MGNCLNAASKRSHRAGMLLPEEEESLSEMRRISQLLREDQEEAVGGYEVAGVHYSVSASAEEEEEDQVLAAAVAPAAAEGVKVKIVLTRGELEWLMAQLKSGEQRLEDVLHHMQAAKGGLAGGDATAGDKAAGWRPRLESILECPETQSELALS